MFNAAINELLMHPDWELWSRRVLPRYTYADEDVQPAVAQHREWYTELIAKRARAAEEAAAKAAAAEAAAAAAEGVGDADAPAEAAEAGTADASVSVALAEQQ